MENGEGDSGEAGGDSVRGVAAVAAVHRVCDSICGWHISEKFAADICVGDMRRRDRF